MKIFTHNFNPNSDSGPNKFTRQLFRTMIDLHKVKIVPRQDQADVEFCLIQQQVHKKKPMILRLDGIYFNSDQDFNRQNSPIKFSYDNADTVVFQSNFNKNLTEHWFGTHKNSHVIHNAPDMSLIRNAKDDYFKDMFPAKTEVWCCASKWRPHKRLNDNIKYFLNHAPENAVLAMAGPVSGEQIVIPDPKKVILLGNLNYQKLLSLYKRSKYFVHLAYLDHCPNVVVDAQASGCHVICSSSGGTSEIVYNGTVIQEEDWDYKPIKLYNPPKIDFSNCYKVLSQQCEDMKPDIVKCANLYYNAFLEVAGR